MKRLLTVLFSLSLLSGGASAQDHSLESLSREFPNPDKAYRTAPLMVWNTEISQYQIDNMLREFHEQGFGGVFIHPRMGLSTPYLSQEWHDMVAYTVRRGEDFGLDVWLYDENSYPSGFAGGHVPRQMPESYNQGQGLKPTEAQVMPADLIPYEVIVSEKNGKFTDITAQAVKMAGKKGHFYLYEKTYFPATAWHAGTPYVDLIKPGVAEKFIEVTMQGYEATLGSDLKKSVRGIFTDEPEIVSPGGLRWTPDLFEQFSKIYGYNLSDCLPSLHQEVGEWKQVRHDYFALLLKLFIDRWAKPWYSYCEQKGIAWTGHYWEHNWPNMTGVPDNMAMAAWQQMPGIDMLFNQFDENSSTAQFGNIRSVKEVRSIANQLGRERILSETYGGAGWNVSFKDLKRLADWQFALGVNFVNQHVSHMSMLGIRKTDYPPMFTRTASWWSDYHLLNDYNGRMSAALSMGDQLNDILLLEPTTSVWLYNNYIGDWKETPAKAIGDAFQALVTRLEKAQVEYDLGCEDVFKNHGSVRGGDFVVGQRAYSTVIIPPLCENLEARTLALLMEFASAGGRVIALGSPALVEGRPSKEAADFFASASVMRTENCSDALIDKYLRNKEVIDFQKVQGGDLYHQRREFTDGQLLLLTNVSLEQATDVALTIKGKHIVRMEALDGKTYDIPHSTRDGQIVLSTRIEPAGSLLLRVSDEAVKAENPREAGTLTALSPMRPLSVERLKENVLPIDFLDLECGDQGGKELYWFDANERVYKAAGLTGNPWFRAMQYGREIVDTDFSKAPGFKATYRFTVSGPEVDIASLVLVVENPNLYTIKINGNVVRGGYYFMVDEDFKRIGVGQYAKVGENIVEISAERPTVFTELASIYVLGNFDVKAVNDRWTIVPATKPTTPGDWIAQGAPFYPWEMRYTKFYDVREAGKRHFVRADNWTGSLAQVWINDRKAGVIFAEPYQLDVTPFLQKGANRVEVRVVGNLENLLGPQFRKYEGYAGPDRWQNIPSGAKASKYFLTPFGLKSDFTFFEEK